MFTVPVWRLNPNLFTDILPRKYEEHSVSLRQTVLEKKRRAETTMAPELSPLTIFKQGCAAHTKLFMLMNQDLRKLEAARHSEYLGYLDVRIVCADTPIALANYLPIIDPDNGWEHDKVTYTALERVHVYVTQYEWRFGTSAPEVPDAWKKVEKDLRALYLDKLKGGRSTRYATLSTWSVVAEQKMKHPAYAQYYEQVMEVDSLVRVPLPRVAAGYECPSPESRLVTSAPPPTAGVCSATEKQGHHQSPDAAHHGRMPPK